MKEFKKPVCDIVQFGKYPQGSKGEIAPIEWLVLDKQKNSLLLISRYGLEIKPYNDESKNITWAECSLRKWLNDDFYQNAFNNEQRILIAKTNVMAERNPEYDTNPGEDAADHMFLLNIQEVRRFFKNEKERLCKPTKYAKIKQDYNICRDIIDSDYKKSIIYFGRSW